MPGMKQRELPSCLLLLLIVWIGSTADAGEPSENGVEYFETHIRPLLVERCYSCHSERADQREGGLRLDSRPGWTEGGEHGPAIVPGDVEASLLIRAVRYADPDLQMPPDRKLTEEEIRHLEHWVRIGAPDPRDDAQRAEQAEPSPSDPVAGREHWAYRPLAHAVPRPVTLADWPRSTIDEFVLAELESRQLRPAPDADRQTFVRRLYFQLLGLPPTPEQVAAFVSDERPDALERLVDELLNSPHFGELWGRHWLDLARYADSNGLDENFLFREAWRYRNWVIAAVNADMPFDRFVLEQIAGDLLPYESIEQRDRQRIAAGFLVIGPKVLLGNDPQNQKMEVADEQLDTIGRALLGQTLGCARCHDHKFDPIPTADYYALAGILTSTQVMERRYMLGEQRVMERLVGLGPDGDELDTEYERYWRRLPRVREQHKHAQAALELLEKEETEALQKLANEQERAVAPEALDTEKAKEERIAAQRALVDELQHTIAHPPPIPPRAMIPADEEKPSNESIRIAGQFNRLGKEVPRGFLQVLCTTPVDLPTEQSGRVELARWLTDAETGAGSLTARVLANRLWHHLMGRGIVRTVDNFGRMGEAPSHPELLDYLAAELIASGWSMKSLVREIVLSRTFGLSSKHDEACHAIDPENVYLWRAHRRRLEPEAMRDAMRMAAGELDLRPMESTVWYLGDQATAVGDNKNRRRTDFPCRSVYLPVIRNDLPEIFEAFDFADPHATTGMRPQTTVAAQGLFLLNHDSVMDMALATARRLIAASGDIEPPRVVEQLFTWTVGAPPTDSERDSIVQFVGVMSDELAEQGVEDARLQAWALACHAVFASSRFQILE